MNHHRANDEAERDQSEQRNTFFDDSERTLPDHEPDDERDGYGPPWKTDARCELERDANAANLRRQHHQADESKYEIKEREIVEAKTLANRVRNGAATDCRKTSCLFYEKDDADATEDDRPNQLEGKITACLCCGGDRTDLKEATDARHDAERDLQDLLHGASSKRSRFTARGSAPRTHPKNTGSRGMTKTSPAGIHMMRPPSC